MLLALPISSNPVLDRFQGADGTSTEAEAQRRHTPMHLSRSFSTQAIRREPGVRRRVLRLDTEELGGSAIGRD